MEGEEDALDENDSDESTLPITRRRREASDDEEDGGIECEDSARFRKIDRGFRFGSGSEPDGLGEAELYDDEESYTEDESDAEQTGLRGDDNRNDEKMNMEPFWVPNFGSFYFHDDRSRDTGDRGQRRRVLNGRKLWETNDEQKWAHDKFEEMMRQERAERQHQEVEVRRICTGFSQGDSKNQGQGSRIVKGTRYRPHENSDNQDKASRVVRGRGPIRYKSLTRSKSIIPSTKRKQSRQSLEKTSNTLSKGVLSHTSDLHSVPPASMKCVSAPSSSSALLYPDGSTSHLSVTQKKDAKPGGTNRNHLRSVLLGEDFAMSKPGVFQQGNTVVHPADSNRFHIKSVHPASGHCLINTSSHSSVSLSAYSDVSSMSLDQGRHLSVEPGPLQGTVRSSLRRPVQKSSQHSEFVSQTPSEAFAVSPFEPGALVSLPGGKSKHESDGKGSGIVQGNERGDLYERSSQNFNFPATPANFPVMQLYDQHHGALGYPAVCACLPCYAFLSTHGIGNSVMAHKEVGTNMASDGKVSRDKPGQNELMNHKAWQQKFKPQRYSKMNFGNQSG